MNRFAPVLTFAALLLAAAGVSPAQEAPSLTVTAVHAPQLVVDYALAGFAPQSVTSGSAWYSATVASGAARITARLSSPLPAGVTLEVRLVAPPGAVATGMVALSTTAADVVQDIPPGSYSALQIVYRLSASVSADVVSFATVDVVFEIMQENN
jgi:hypothetical protein